MNPFNVARDVSRGSCVLSNIVFSEILQFGLSILGIEIYVLNCALMLNNLFATTEVIHNL